MITIKRKRLFFILPLIFINLLLPAEASHFLTVKNGLTQNQVTSIIQDQKGFIWMATEGGLNKYNGYEFVKFKPEPLNKNSLLSVSIEVINQDRQGNIWIGYKTSGVSKYDPIHNKFTHYFTKNDEDSTGISAARIVSIFQDNKGDIWFGSWENGVFRYNIKSGLFTRIKTKGKIVKSLKQLRTGKILAATTFGIEQFDECKNRFIPVEVYGITASVNTIIEDPFEPVIYIGGWEFGLIKYNYKIKQGQKIKIGNIENDCHKSRTIHVYALQFDFEGNLWIGTWGQGLFYYDRKNSCVSKYKRDAGDNRDNSVRIILDVICDKSGVVWIGTNGEGTFKILPDNYFKTYTFFNDRIKNPSVLSFVEDNNTLFIGTKGHGVFSKNINGIEKIKLQNERNGEIKCLYKAKNNKIWAGTDNGLRILTKQNGKLFFSYPNDYGIDSKTRRKKITAVLDADSLFFVGTQQSGLLLFLKKGKNNYCFIKHFYTKQEGNGRLQNDRVSFIFCDSKKQIWIGSYDGLYLYSKKERGLINILSRFKDNLMDPVILSIAEDSNNNLWIGTANGFYCVWKEKDKIWRHNKIDCIDKLNCNYINSIEVDKKNKVWMSTDDKLVCYNPKSNLLYLFNENDGLPSNGFNEMSSAKIENGKLVFGGKNGFVKFVPSMIKTNNHVPPIVFTKLTIMGENVTPGKIINNRVILKKEIGATNKIELPYNCRMFSVEFAALDFVDPLCNEYAYILEGINNNWVKLGKQNKISFHNLSKGNYKLWIKGANNSSVWNQKGTMLEIKVLPPYWKTWYAFIIYVISIIAIIELLRINYEKRINLAKKVEMQELKIKQDSKLNDMKLRFFTYIFHEFRTPLTLIAGPIKEIRNSKKFIIDNKIKNYLNLIHINTQRLLKLIDIMVDYQKKCTGNVILCPSFVNIKDFFSEIIEPYRVLANTNSIKFDVDYGKMDVNSWIDRDKMEMVINNILSNAFKFVNKENGEIIVKLFCDKDVVNIRVKDNGKGIKKEEKKMIFDNFYQIGKGDNDKGGIGLAAAKEIIELHDGNILVKSSEGKGTEFCVSFPVEGEENIERSRNRVENFGKENDLKKRQKQICRVLIVEDDKEMREYVKQLLIDNYWVMVAANVKEAIKILDKNAIDIIISDVMMPGMDGFEFCQLVKANDKWKYIPIILLTAKNPEQYKIMGIEKGADDYISKPFDPEYLRVRVKNLFDNRRKTEEVLCKKIMIEPTHITIDNHEEEFIEKAIHVVENNLLNDEFNSKMFAQEMNMSNSSLYRKLTELTNLSISAFIRNIKLKRAAQLLEDQKITISEIATQVGFRDIKYFRNSFVKEFGCTPSEFRKKLNLMDENE